MDLLQTPAYLSAIAVLLTALAGLITSIKNNKAIAKTHVKVATVETNTNGQIATLMEEIRTLHQQLFEKNNTTAPPPPLPPKV